MPVHFELGSVVRIIGLPNSEWQNSRGIVVGVLPGLKTSAEGEYAVELQNGCRRWFLERHLARSVPERLVRCFRVEVQDRWKQLDPNQVAILSGDHEELVYFVRDACGFTMNRARAEAEEFFQFFNERMQRAAAGATNVQRPFAQAA